MIEIWNVWRTIAILTVVCLLSGFETRVHADERSLPNDWPIESVVDYYVESRQADRSVEPSGQINDTQFARRIYLDLVGRMPSYPEAMEFDACDRPDKRQELVDRLLNSTGFIRHQSDELETLLMYPDDGNMRDYLMRAVKQDIRWDQVFTDVVTAQQANDEGGGASAFIKARLKDTDKLTNEISVRFFGVNISCAQCHDHPLVAAWTQDHYYGMKSFFDRTFDNGGFIAEREFGFVSYRTTKGEQRQAKLMFLSGNVVSEPTYMEPNDEAKQAEKKRLDEAKKDKKPSPAPTYSRRNRLIEVGLGEAGRQWLAKSLVNRLWYRLFGHGLVMPLDQMHVENSASHPQLLDWLARDLIEHKYDVKRLIRGLVLSRTYSRDSAWSGKGSRPESDLFAVARVRPLTPHQLGASLKVATLEPTSISTKVLPAEREQKLDAAAQAGRSLSPRFEMPSDEMQISVSEALFMTNGSQVAQELLAGGLAAQLASHEDVQQIVDTAVQSILLRHPDPEESMALVEFVSQRMDDRQSACRQLVWTLLTSTEFRFNF